MQENQTGARSVEDNTQQQPTEHHTTEKQREVNTGRQTMDDYTAGLPEDPQDTRQPPEDRNEPGMMAEGQGAGCKVTIGRRCR